MKIATTIFVVLAVLLSGNLVCAQTQPPLEDALKPPTPSLAATLTAEELSGSARLSGSKKSVLVSIVNSGKRALIVNGDKAVIDDGSKQQALSRNQVIPDPPKVNIPGDFAAVGASFGSFGAFPVVDDHIKKKHSPEGLYYGKEEKRREVAAARFGQRVLFPGETSDGELFLSREAKLPAQFTIPVSSHPDGAELGVLVLSVVASSQHGLLDAKGKVPDRGPLEEGGIDARNKNRRDSKKAQERNSTR